jgi:hypothetical protein
MVEFDEELSWMAIVAEAKLDSSVQPKEDATTTTNENGFDEEQNSPIDFSMYGYESLFVKMESDSEDIDSLMSRYGDDDDEPTQQQPLQLVLISAKKGESEKRKGSSVRSEDVEVIGAISKSSKIVMASSTFWRFNFSVTANGVLLSSSRIALEVLYFLSDRVWEISESYLKSSIHMDDPDFEAMLLCSSIPDLAYGLRGQPLGALTAMQRQLISSVIQDFTHGERQRESDREGEGGDDEDGYVVIGSVPQLCPPTFSEADNCSYCKAAFSVGTFRHHCRNCGSSVCSAHSSQRRRLAHYGGLYTQRVCDDCCILIDLAKETQVLFWRKARLAAYFANKLEPYFHATERGVDKVLRLTGGALDLVRSSLISSVPAKMALESLSLLRVYGTSGATGILLRQDFLEAAETLRSLSGFDEADMGLHEMTTSILYLIALNRGRRGDAPEQEQQEHTEEGCAPLSDAALDEALIYAPLGCVAVYMPDEVECQRVAASQGWATIVAELEAGPEVPAFALFASPTIVSSTATGDDDGEDGSEAKASPHRKEAVLAIRGTKSLQDIVTDIRCEPVPFPLRVESEPSDSEDDAEEEEEEEGDCGGGAKKPPCNTWMKVSASEGTYACGGMARAAERICEKTAPLLHELHQQGYAIRIVGHSLGGAVAALLAVLIRSYHHSIFPSLRCYAYSCPNCMDRATAESLDGTVVSVVCRDDIVSRLRPASVRALVRELTDFKEEALQFLQEDWQDVLSRAKQLWAPRRRTAAAGAGAGAAPDPGRTGPGDDSSPIQASNSDIDQDLADLWLPGQICHIYRHRGRYQVASVPRDFPSLRCIQVHSNMLRDHFAKSTFNALAECRTTRSATHTPPAWTPFHRTGTCEACGSAFAWHSTLQGKPAQCRERHNCRVCGKLVCTPCTDAKRTVPKFGFIFPVRICVACQLSGGHEYS